MRDVRYFASPMHASPMHASPTHSKVTWVWTSSGEIKFYVDGVHASTRAVELPTSYADDAIATIGGWRRVYNAQYFSGVVDDVMMFSSALSDADIAYIATGDGVVSQ